MIKDISIIIPTYNEGENIGDVLTNLIKVLAPVGINYELIVVDDDSKDDTANIATNIIKNKGKVIVRKNVPKGLSLSVLDGFKAAANDYIVVMDGDGSHNPETIVSFIKALEEGFDLVIASRYVKGGGSKNFPLKRKVISRFACLLGRLVTKIKDNTSGFFAFKKSIIKDVNLTPFGFKIGLEVFVKANYHKFQEVPYVFLDRIKGKSKLKSKVVIEYIGQIINLFFYNKERKKCI